MKRSFAYIAFYDLDHTILKGNSATSLIVEARKRGIMSSKNYRHAVYLSILYKLNIGDPSKMINRMLIWLKGIKEETIRTMCQDVFKETLLETIRPEILTSLEEHRTQNGAIVLLSSATSPICESVTKHLELDDVICTELDSDSGILTGRTRGKLVYGMEKKHRLYSYCHEHGYDHKNAYYYGDSHTDKHVMEAVGNPVAVSPDKRLLKIATSRNWPILAQDL